MAVAGDTTSAEFRAIQAEAAALKQQIVQVDMALDGMAMTTTQKLGGALDGVTGAFSAVQGTMGALGIESEAVNSALLKVQSAMALQQGVASIQQALPAITALKNGAVAAFRGMTAAGKAFALTGIGLVITLLAAAASSLNVFGNSSESAEEKQAQLDAQLKKTNRQLQLQKEAADSLSTTLDDRFKKEINNAIKAGASEKELGKIRKEQSQERIKYLKSEEDRLSNQYLNASKNASNEQFEAIEKAYNDSTKARKAAEQELDDLVTNSIQQEREAAKEKAEIAKQRASEAAQQRKDALAQLRDAQNEFAEEERLSYMTEQEREVYEVNKKYEELIKLAEKYKQDTAILKENQLNEVNNINTKYAQEELTAEAEKQARLAEFQKQANEEAAQREEDFFESYRQATISQQQLEIDAAREKWDVLIADAEKYGADTTVLKTKQEEELAAVDKKYKDEQAAREKVLADQRIDAVKGGLDAIANLAGAFAGKSEKSQRRAFNIQKAAGIASATIDTYKSAQAAFASAGNPILGAVFAAIAVAAGIANIAKISKTKFEGGGGAGSVSTPSSTAAASSITTPEFNIVGGNTANQLAGLGQQPVQAYVVSNEVTTAQSLDRNRVQNATL
jgi:hypothetical protein